MIPPRLSKKRGRARHLLVQSRTSQKSFVFLQNQNCKQNFSVVGRAAAGLSFIMNF